MPISTPVVVVALFKAHAGKEEFFIERTRLLMEKMRAHRGILLHSFQQDENDPSLFLFYEKYVSEEALREHAEHQEIADWRAELPSMAERLLWHRFSAIDSFSTMQS